MNTGKKPRGDSKLKNLPEERQEQIFEWCRKSFAHARRQLAEDGLMVSGRALSEWHSWYRRKSKLELGNNRVLQALEWYRRNRPDATPEEIRRAQLMALSLQAEAEDDKKLQLAVAKETGKDLDRDLDKAKFEVATCERFLKWYGVRQARSIAESNLSNADKIAKLRREFFADVDALEASGEVELPE